MAGDWIPMQKATASKPEILRIASILKCSVGDAFLGCFRFWCWCDDQLTDGRAMGVTFDMLDALFGRAGLCAALAQVGWLEDASEGDKIAIFVPHFDRHLSQGAKKRALAKRKKQRQRSRSCPAPMGTETGLQDRTEENRTEQDINTFSKGSDLHPREFKSLDRGLIRFEEFAALGKVLNTPTERRRFLVLWRWVGLRRSKKPVASFLACLKAKEWNGSEAIEAEVEAFLKSKLSKRYTGTPEAVAALAAAKGVEDLPEDHL